MDAVVRGEEHTIADNAEVLRPAVVAVVVADVLDQDRPRSRAVGAPQLPPVDAVVRGEEHRVRGRDDLLRSGDVVTAGALDVLDQHGPRSRAVGAPQLPPVDAVVGGEEQPTAHGRTVGRVARRSRGVGARRSARPGCDHRSGHRTETRQRNGCRGGDRDCSPGPAAQLRVCRPCAQRLRPSPALSSAHRRASFDPRAEHVVTSRTDCASPVRRAGREIGCRQLRRLGYFGVLRRILRPSRPRTTPMARSTTIRTEWAT